MRPYDDEKDEVVTGWIKLAVGLTLALGLFMLWVIFAPSASSHNFECGPRSKLVGSLQERYEEKPLWLGLRNTRIEGMPVQLYVELWIGENTYTITSGVQGGDQLCIITTGQEWVLSPEVAPPIGREAGEQEP